VTHWSVRRPAEKFGAGKTTVNALLREGDIKPRVVKTFKLGVDEHVEEKLTDVVGLYLNLPDNAIVLYEDEKSKIQALERSAMLLSLGPHISAL
jgi:hypothetical protein